MSFSNLMNDLVYPDPGKKKIPTVGIGHNLTVGDSPKKLALCGLDHADVKAGKVSLTEDQIQQLFEIDIQERINQCKNLDGKLFYYSVCGIKY